MKEHNEYDDPAKGVAWAAFWQAYKQKCGVPKPIHKRAARTQFERWWSRNAE